MAQDGDTLTGTLASAVKISIAANATVTLSGAIIDFGEDDSYELAGITCEGDATIILEETNVVKSEKRPIRFLQHMAATRLLLLRQFR